MNTQQSHIVSIQALTLKFEDQAALVNKIIVYMYRTCSNLYINSNELDDIIIHYFYIYDIIYCIVHNQRPSQKLKQLFNKGISEYYPEHIRQDFIMLYNTHRTNYTTHHNIKHIFMELLDRETLYLTILCNVIERLPDTTFKDNMLKCGTSPELCQAFIASLLE